ncbi:MAG: 6-phosphofructokinase, partial [Candidatus Methylomirabilales bacterium]
MAAYRGTIGILTGGGDVPGLNPAIRAITIRALHEGYRVLGIRRGWAGLIEMVPDKDADCNGQVQVLTEDIVNRAGRTGGTFIHTSRTRPSRLPKILVPEHLKNKYAEDVNDVTPDVLKNLEFLGVDVLIPIGGDDTLSYAQRLHEEGVKVKGLGAVSGPGRDHARGRG